MTRSALTTRASAGFLGFAGLALLFAADEVLPIVAPGFPAAFAWLGQLLGAAWLGVAAVNWLQRGILLGGIYGRPVVMANAMPYFVSAMVLLKALSNPATSAGLWILVVPVLIGAVSYTLLLFRGPFDPSESEPRPVPAVGFAPNEGPAQESPHRDAPAAGS